MTPLGIKVEWIHRYERLKDIQRAIKSRTNKDENGNLYINYEIPDEWYVEYANHISWFSVNKPEQLIEFI